MSGARDDGITIGAKGHPLETEAERIANQVVEAPVTAAGATETLRVQLLNGFAGTDGDHAPDSVERVLSGPGRSLDPALRQDMEQRFGHPLTRVRVHAYAAAAQSAQDVDARAYTVGDDIVFGAGQYAPDTNQGRRLIAHEVTHVLQQSGSNGLVQRAGPAQPPASLGVGQPDCGTRVSDVFWLGPAFQDPARPECSFAEIYELKDMSRHRRYRADLPLATTPPCKEGDQKSHDFRLRYGKNEWRILEIWSGGVIVMNACGDKEILGVAPPPAAKPEAGVGVEESNFGPGRVQTFDNCERVVFTPDLRGEELEWVLETWKRPGIPEMKVFVATKGQKIPYSPTDLSAMLRVYLYGEKCGEPLPPPEPEPSPIEVE